MDLNTIQAVARPRGRAEFPAWQAGDAYLAGGTWLFSEPQPRLTRLIDLGTLGWEPLRVTPAGLEIAATCKIAQLDAATLPVDWTAAPLINQCARAFLASFKIWNMATVGGNLCMSLPAGPMISLTAALDGTCIVWKADGSEQKIPVVDFVKAPLQNALSPGDLLRRIDLPVTALTRRTAFRQISLSKLGRSGALLIGTLAARRCLRAHRHRIDTTPAAVFVRETAARRPTCAPASNTNCRSPPITTTSMASRPGAGT